MAASDLPVDLSGSFAAIDFETATSERSSACALAVVVFRDGSPAERFKQLIRLPENLYDPFNTWIHGIGPDDTEHAPAFPRVWNSAVPLLRGRLVVAHNTAFDMSVLRRTAEYYDHELEPMQFACTYRVARSAMPDAESWRLEHMAREFGIPLDHHEPLSDAEAAGFLWVTLARRLGLSHAQLLERWGYRLGRVDPIIYAPFSNAAKGSSGSLSAKDFTPVGTPDSDGLLFAKKVVFTGTLDSMPRREAFQAVVDAGAVPSQSVSARTDYLIVGLTDLRKVGPTGMSSKYRKARALIDEGHDIRIIDEDQFVCLLAGTPIGAVSETPGLSGVVEPVESSRALPITATPEKPRSGRFRRMLRRHGG